MEQNKLIERFAEVQGITYEEAEQQIGSDNEEDIIKYITDFTKQQINSLNQFPVLNRKQRRSLQKKLGKNNPMQENIDTIADISKKLNYIDLIEKLRKLNAEKENENNDSTN